MDDLGGHVVADIQQPPRLHVEPGFLLHLPHQRLRQGLPGLKLPAGQRPRPPRAGVLVEQQYPAVLDDDPRHANSHHATLHAKEPARPDNSPSLVVVAAGGLGTRVRPWSQFIPKEWCPVGGQPGIVALLGEIAALGPARVAVVYHPYYEQFAAWAALVLGRGDHARYAAAAGIPAPPAVPGGVTVEFIRAARALRGHHVGPQRRGQPRGRLLPVRRVRRQPLPGTAPLPQLRDSCPGDVTVLASRYRRALAGSRGVLIMARTA